ncbi:Zn-dependent hydrolase [uncultured Tateyamaria sp.]|uniref:Zn-dependent hydrolase n=1 Tax=uncultured Tateyamaria sp. TaxID=455651 RepID=UPI00261D56E2|nr:Zn-dependent hydrolase [uncultured Tateyamaria sp.]
MTRVLDWSVRADEPLLAEKLFADIAAIGPDKVGVSRPAFSDIETASLNYLKWVAELHGLTAAFDEGQNLVMSLPQDENADRFVLVGSHMDSVPMGGNFDGLAGVIAGLMCLMRAHSSGARFALPVKVIAMRGEESAWFGPCYIGSKALMGMLDKSELAAAHKGDQRSLDDHMKRVGIDTAPVRAGRALLPVKQLLEYIELHIEQGPLLVGKDLPAAVVSGIRGNFRHKQIRCVGETGHSGAVPRAFRHDPVLAVADLFMRLDDGWQAITRNGGDLVVTSGMVHTDVDKDAISRIADHVDFSLDVRSLSPDTLDDMRALLTRELSKIEAERGVRFELDSANQTAPAQMHTRVVTGLQAAMKRAGFSPLIMPSGGGHDAAVFANAGVPTGMVFIRNGNGSHNPDEAMDIDDFLAGMSIIYTYLMEEPASQLST